MGARGVPALKPPDELGAGTYAWLGADGLLGVATLGAGDDGRGDDENPPEDDGVERLGEDENPPDDDLLLELLELELLLDDELLPAQAEQASNATMPAAIAIFRKCILVSFVVRLEECGQVMRPPFVLSAWLLLSARRRP